MSRDDAMRLALVTRRLVGICLALALSDCSRDQATQPDRSALSPVRESKSVPAIGRKVALVVGTDRYDDDAWPDLVRPWADAQAIAHELVTRYGFELLPIVASPTVEEFDRALVAAKTTTGPDDDLLVFVAGHGYFDEAGAQGYLIFRDSPPPDRCRIGGCYPMSTVRTTLETAPARHILVAVDACHGGTFQEDLAVRSEKADVATLVRDYSRFKSRLVLTSGGNNRVSDDSDFARAVLETLRTPGAAGVVSYEALVGAISLLPSHPSWGRFSSSQRHDPGGTFLLVAAADTKSPPASADPDRGRGAGSPAKTEPPEFRRVAGGTWTFAGRTLEVGEPFLYQTTPVSLGQWREVVLGLEPMAIRGRNCQPNTIVHGVSGVAILQYLNARSRLEGLPECYDLSACAGSAANGDLACGHVLFRGIGCEGYRLPSAVEARLARGPSASQSDEQGETGGPTSPRRRPLFATLPPDAFQLADVKDEMERGFKAYEKHRHPEALREYLAATSAAPGYPDPRYNAAAVMALMRRDVEALAGLEELLDLGIVGDVNALAQLLLAANDRDFESLHQDARFTRIVASARSLRAPFEAARYAGTPDIHVAPSPSQYGYGCGPEISAAESASAPEYLARSLVAGEGRQIFGELECRGGGACFLPEFSPVAGFRAVRTLDVPTWYRVPEPGHGRLVLPPEMRGTRSLKRHPDRVDVTIAQDAFLPSGIYEFPGDHGHVAIREGTTTSFAPGAHNSVIIAGSRFRLDDDVIVRTFEDPDGLAIREDCPNPDGMPCTGHRYFGPGARVEADDLQGLRNLISLALFHQAFEPDAASARDWLVEKALSVHFIIDWDGVIYELVDPVRCAYNAGEANNTEIGIDLVNLAGNLLTEPRAQPYPRDHPRSAEMREPRFTRAISPTVEINGAATRTYGYTDAQYRSLAALARLLVSLFPGIEPDFPAGADWRVLPRVMEDWMSFHGFVAHWHVEADHWDPGPGFDWERFRRDLRREIFVNSSH